MQYVYMCYCSYLEERMRRNPELQAQQFLVDAGLPGDQLTGQVFRIR